LDAYAAHAAFAEMLAPVEQRLDAIADHPSGAAEQTSVEAYRLLDEARLGHAQGRLTFTEPIDRASELIEQGEQAILVEQRRLQAEVERSKLVRKTVAIAASVLAAAFLVMLAWMNVRRRPSLRLAHARFDQRSKAVGRELEKVDEILARSETILGSRESFGERKFEGQTFALGQETFQRLENLKDISKETRRVLDLCHELLHPSNPIAEAANMFARTRYEHCLSQLNGKSLQVPGQVTTDGKTALPVWMTFDELFSDLHSRKIATTENLDALQSSQGLVDSKIVELQTKIDEATELEQELSKASRMDRLFKIPAMFGSLLPTAQLDCDRAVSCAANDPIRATRDEIPQGLRKINEGLSVALAIKKAREEVFVQLDESTDKLQQSGFDIRWVEKRVNQLGQNADQLLEEASQRSIAQDADMFANDVSRLGLRARRCVELAQEIACDVAPSIDGLEQRILATRQEISKQLGIDLSAVLREPQYDPDVDLEQARKQLQSAKAALDYGGVESVMESLEVIEIELDQGHRLIDSSRKAVKEFRSDFRDRKNEFNQLVGQLPALESTITSTRTRYADSAMTMRGEDFLSANREPMESQAEPLNILQLLNGCKQRLDQSRSSVESALQLHQEAKLLQAANSLGLIQDDLQKVDETFREIETHCRHVDQLATDNASLVNQRNKRLESLQTEVEDSRSQRSTEQEYSILTQNLQQFSSEFLSNQTPRDPFLDATTLTDFENRIDQLAATLRSDRQAFAEATKALGGAEAEWAVSERLVARSLNDRIPDSVNVKRAQEEARSLEDTLKDLAARLNVPHENWSEINQQATELNSKLGVINGRLRHELNLAQEAVEALSQAADKVYEAANWHGSYNVVVVGRPGSDELQQARQLLARGQYSQSIGYSQSARQSSTNAILEAERQVQQQQRIIARRAAEQRRQREANAFAIGSGSSSVFGAQGSSFGSNSSSRSWTSSGSRTNTSSGSSSSSHSSSSSRSSSGGDSSGFSRSGW
jgi:hypothetical protein